MAVRITAVKPIDLPSDKLEAHLAMQIFSWLNEQTQQKGEASRDYIFDWIVNKKGKAYVKNPVTGDNIYIFGATTPTGQKYIRTAEDGKWTDWLIDLEKQSSAPSGAAK